MSVSGKQKRTFNLVEQKFTITLKYPEANFLIVILGTGMMCNGEMCPKKCNFMSGLILKEKNHELRGIAFRIATVKLCAHCSYRMFILPTYSVDERSKEVYERLWEWRASLPILMSPIAFNGGSKLDRATNHEE